MAGSRGSWVPIVGSAALLAALLLLVLVLTVTSDDTDGTRLPSGSRPGTPTVSAGP